MPIARETCQIGLKASLVLFWDGRWVASARVWALLLEILALQQKPERRDCDIWKNKAPFWDDQRPNTASRLGPVLDLPLKG